MEKAPPAMEYAEGAGRILPGVNYVWEKIGIGAKMDFPKENFQVNWWNQHTHR